MLFENIVIGYIVPNDEEITRISIRGRIFIVSMNPTALCLKRSRNEFLVDVNM